MEPKRLPIVYTIVSLTGVSKSFCISCSFTVHDVNSHTARIAFKYQQYKMSKANQNKLIFTFLILIFVSFKYKNSYISTVKRITCSHSWSVLGKGARQVQMWETEEFLRCAVPTPLTGRGGGRMSGSGAVVDPSQAGTGEFSCALWCLQACFFLAVQFKTADSCSWDKLNNHEYALIFFLQVHFVGNQAGDTLMQIDRLELKLQEYTIVHSGGTKDKDFKAAFGLRFLFLSGRHTVNAQQRDEVFRGDPWRPLGFLNSYEQ